ncbi:MAG: tRNA (adenine-N1)-methyltransferase [Candidatus Heimdallarchaeum aukensis]|uniref:tRNA (Adenine-N1)-methyltransferase n=1 Tax=Candidatus Heimdallarchaeum aukensis TaxID=2876573 RepID=A0A9Y1BKW7_9ARCH|nr:MAG: tRNA (adenine-N1)-methyltransferase [Candidatus Heimdallarchaeum aukensis]
MSEDCKKNNCIKNNDRVLIVFDNRRKWIRKVEENKKFHCNKGFFEFNDIIGKPYGLSIVTNKGIRLFIYKPLLTDYLHHFEFKSQIIYPKDLGYIILNSGIKPGTRIIEAGTGSGALTSVLATYVQPTGHVFTYEVREQAHNIAKKNIERLGLGLSEYITFKLADAKKGFEERNVDCVFLDLADPWEIIPFAKESLKPSGTITLFIPTANQLEKTYISLKENNFTDIKAIELIEREMQLKENAIRPKTWQYVAHTGYLMFARKTAVFDE